MDNLELVIITPVYEDAESARTLFRELSGVVKDARIVAVDDGSLRHPLGEDALRSAGMKGAVIKLRRNLGHQGAIAVGLSYARESLGNFDCAIVMDADGEDAPASVRVLLQGFAESRADVRVAERKKRHEPLQFRLFYRMYRFLFRLFTGRTINFGNFMALKPAAVSRLTAMNEIWIHLPASVIASKLTVEGRRVDRGIRYSGSSKMNFLALVLHGSKGIIVFSEQVLLRMGGASLVVALTSVVMILVAVLLKIVHAATPGWASTVIASVVLIFLQTGVLTLVTLMITGLVRTSTLNRIDYKAFVERVIEVD